MKNKKRSPEFKQMLNELEADGFIEISFKLTPKGREWIQEQNYIPDNIIALFKND